MLCRFFFFCFESRCVHLACTTVFWIIDRRPCCRIAGKIAVRTTRRPRTRTWPINLDQPRSSSWTFVALVVVVVVAGGGGGGGAWTFSRRICYAFYRAPGRPRLSLSLSYSLLFISLFLSPSFAVSLSLILTRRSLPLPILSLSRSLYLILWLPRSFSLSLSDSLRLSLRFVSLVLCRSLVLSVSLQPPAHLPLHLSDAPLHTLSSLRQPCSRTVAYPYDFPYPHLPRASSLAPSARVFFIYSAIPRSNAWSPRCVCTTMIPAFRRSAATTF